MQTFITLGSVLMAASFTGCGDDSGGSIGSDVTGDAAVLVDRQGVEWDVTHARDAYGMDPELFHFGLGVGAIASFDSPVVVDSTSSGYPDQVANAQLEVYGVNYNDEQRAYPVDQLTQHEVFNEAYPGEGGTTAYLAVTY
jgi:hypothetical protein